MDKNKRLKFAFLRTEKDNKYRLFLEIAPSILEQDVEVDLNNEMQLIMKLENGEQLVTGKLPLDIYDSLANRKTTVFFVDHDGVILASNELDPLMKHNKKNKP